MKFKVIAFFISLLLNSMVVKALLIPAVVYIQSVAFVPIDPEDENLSTVVINMKDLPYWCYAEHNNKYYTNLHYIFGFMRTCS